MTDPQFTRDQIVDGYDKVPNGLWTLEVSAGARIVLGWLHSHTDGFLATLTLNRCRRMLGTSKVSKYLDELETLGFVTIDRTGGRGHPVTFHLHGQPWLDLCRRGVVGPDGLTHQAQMGSGVGPDGRAQMGPRREIHQQDDQPRSAVTSENASEWVAEHADVDDVHTVDDIPAGRVQDRIRGIVDKGGGHELSTDSPNRLTPTD